MPFSHRQSVQEPPLEVTSEGFLEAALDEDELEAFLDAEDRHDYFYAGVRYRFSQGKRIAGARRYDSQPGEADIYPRTAPAYISYYDPFLAAIVRHLQEETPTHRIRLLCRNGYRDIDINRLLTHQGSGWRFVGWFWVDPWRPLILFIFIFVAALLRALIAYSH
jgi:hypothetical protein